MNRIEQAIREPRLPGAPAIVAYLTAGFPDTARFLAQLRAAASAADVVEIGVPFSDPMADGPTIQRSSRVALGQGTTLAWLLAELAAMRGELAAPLLLMSYLNPLLACGIETLARAARTAGVDGLVVPDLPLEESSPLHDALQDEQIALVQFVAPTTPIERARRLAASCEGFLYALTQNGVTGRDAALPDEALRYLARVRGLSPVPVCAGFGIRSPAQIARLAPHVDGVIVGSALVEALEQGADAGAWIRALRPDSMAA